MIVLSSGEAEYYSLAKRSAIGLCAMVQELGVSAGREFDILHTDENNEIEVGTDSSVSKSIASRRGTLR